MDILHWLRRRNGPRAEEWEGTERLLFEDKGNPYESVYIRVKFAQGRMTLIDSECDHGPDGGWSHKFFDFDEENTRKVLSFLGRGGRDPLSALQKMLNGRVRTKKFLRACEDRGIAYQEGWAI